MSRLRAMAVGLTVIIIGLSVTAAFLAIGDLRSTSIASREDRADLRIKLTQVQDQAEAQGAAADALEEQLRALGERPVVTPPPLNTVPRIAALPSFAQVRSAVEALLPAALAAECGGSCKGEKGESIPGPPGESVKGDKGDKGDTGESGPPGRGITSGPTCNADGTWTTTFTDGTTETQDGPCRAGLIPDPEPTE